MMYLVRQQDPNTEKVGLISYSELLLHAVTKLSLWCFIGGRSAFITTSLLKSGRINRHSEGKNDIP